MGEDWIGKIKDLWDLEKGYFWLALEIKERLLVLMIDTERETAIEINGDLQ